MASDYDENTGCGIVCILVLCLLIWVVSSSFEAASFNRVTGKNVSTWDAMFIDLRVQESPK